MSLAHVEKCVASWYSAKIDVKLNLPLLHSRTAPREPLFLLSNNYHSKRCLIQFHFISFHNVSPSVNEIARVSQHCRNHLERQFLQRVKGDVTLSPFGWTAHFNSTGYRRGDFNTITCGGQPMNRPALNSSQSIPVPIYRPRWEGGRLDGLGGKSDPGPGIGSIQQLALPPTAHHAPS